jgi:putative DNA primase/helicase
MVGEVAIKLGILPWNPNAALDAGKPIFETWLAERGGAGAAEDRAAKDQVAAFIAKHGTSRFQSLDDAASADDQNPIHNRAGFKRKTATDKIEYLVSPGVWNEEVCAGLNPKAVALVLKELGHLVPDDAGKASQSIRVPGMSRARFYVVHESICEDDDAD